MMTDGEIWSWRLLLTCSWTNGSEAGTNFSYIRTLEMWSANTERGDKQAALNTRARTGERIDTLHGIIFFWGWIAQCESDSLTLFFFFFLVYGAGKIRTRPLRVDLAMLHFSGGYRE